MVGVTDRDIRVDVDPNGRHWSLLSFRFPPRAEVSHLSEFERAELKFFSADVCRRRRHDERKRRVWKLLPDSKIFRRDSEPPKSENVSTRFSHSSDLCPGDLVDGQSSPLPTFSPSSWSFVALQLPLSPMFLFR